MCHEMHALYLNHPWSISILSLSTFNTLLGYCVKLLPLTSVCQVRNDNFRKLLVAWRLLAPHECCRQLECLMKRRFQIRGQIKPHLQIGELGAQGI